MSGVEIIAIGAVKNITAGLVHGTHEQNLGAVAKTVTITVEVVSHDIGGVRLVNQAVTVVVNGVADLRNTGVGVGVSIIAVGVVQNKTAGLKARPLID